MTSSCAEERVIRIRRRAASSAPKSIGFASRPLRAGQASSLLWVPEPLAALDTRPRGRPGGHTISSRRGERPETGRVSRAFRRVETTSGPHRPMALQEQPQQRVLISPRQAPHRIPTMPTTIGEAVGGNCDGYGILGVTWPSPTSAQGALPEPETVPQDK